MHKAITNDLFYYETNQFRFFKFFKGSFIQQEHKCRFKLISINEKWNVIYSFQNINEKQMRYLLNNSS